MNETPIPKKQLGELAERTSIDGKERFLTQGGLDADVGTTDMQFVRLYNVVKNSLASLSQYTAPSTQLVKGELDKKVDITSIVDNLTIGGVDVPLSAEQGKALKALFDALEGKIGVADGIASLDASGKIPASQIPAVALVDVFPVSSEAAMLALDAEQGDMAIRSDTGQTFILTSAPAATLGNWVELSALKALVDAAIAEVKGSGYTSGTLKSHEDAITTLNADDATEGSVLKSIKDEAENAKFTPTTESGIESVTIEGAVNEVGVGLDEHKSAIMPHIFQDLSTGKKYRYGFQLSAEGNPQTIYEEIVE